MKVPALIQNVYRDLRDRRMLSIAITLVVAIIAVPLLMKGSGGEEAASTSAPAPATAPFAGDEQLDPVVLAEVPGLRDFRERLAGYSSHNPFKVAYHEPKPAGGNGAGTGSGSGSGSDVPPPAPGEGDVPAPTPSEGDVPAADPSDGGSTDTGGSTEPAETTPPSPSGDGDDSSGDGDDSSGGSELISYRIDVRVGPVGQTKVLKEVESFSFLPERKHPLVQYIDADTGGTKVAFVVNPAAAALKGNGKCIRNQKDCQYLVLEPGDERYFLFDERQYRIELLSINEHREPYQPKSGSDDGDDAERGRNVLTGD